MKNILFFGALALSLNTLSQAYNVALNQTYSASIMDTTVNTDADPERAFDDDTTTFWACEQYPTQWIAVDFSEPTSIDSVTFWYGQNPAANTTQEYYITYDGVNWILHETAIHYHFLGTNGVVNTFPNYTHVFSTPITGALGYKIQTIINPSWVQWREIEVWGFQCSIVDMNITQTDTLLYVNQSGALYQWLDCDNDYALINGETNQSYTPGNTGNYAVQVTMNGCVDTSACIFVDFTGIDEIESLISVHPNPTKDEITLSIGTELLGTGFVVTDNAGRIILTDTFKSSKQIVNLTRFDNGVYFIRTDKESPVKIIKQ